jgi:DNA polymerase-3 subunit alpha
MNTIARLGLVKFDFLGLRYLSIIDNAEKAIRETKPDYSFPTEYNDAETFKLIASGATNGVFQLESSGMKQVLVQLSPDKFDDITAAIALYRPGPMESIPKYIARRHGREPVEYADKQLEPILSSTYGCIVYQEQVMEICRELAGYSYGQADIVRRAMSKKKGDAMRAERVNFINGAKERGISPKAAEEIFDAMESFASYAFNKSHAVSYAVLSYKTAYLKRHFPAEFMAALLTSVLGWFGKTAEYITECNKLGIKTLPPDINESGKLFTVTGGNIRYGLLALKNLGERFADCVIDERRIGKFTSLSDFITRMKKRGLLKKQLEILIKSGAFDSFGIFRSRLLAIYDTLLGDGNAYRAVSPDQLDMFSGAGAIKNDNSVKYPDINELSKRDLLTFEKEVSGMYFSGHMTDSYTKEFEKLAHTPIAEVADSGASDYTGPFRDGYAVKIAGIIAGVTKKKTKAGKDMAFITVEDRFAEIEVVIFPKLYDSYEFLLTEGTAVYCEGKLSMREDEPPKLLCDKLTEVMQEKIVAPKKPPRLFIRLPSEKNALVAKVENFIYLFRGDTEVVFYYKDSGKYIKRNDISANTDGVLVGELKNLLGNDNVIMK